MKNIEIRNKGFITLEDKVMVSDPCYGMGTWCQGNYKCEVAVLDEGLLDKRISSIEVIHENYTNKTFAYYKENFEVGVDSGQAGIFDYEYYVKYHQNAGEHEHVNENWYDKVCKSTWIEIKNPDYKPFDFEKYKDNFIEAHNEYMMSRESEMYIGYNDGNTIDGLGFVSSSGYGDGSYDCWVAYNNDGKVIAIRVEYITEDEEDE